ncbi:MAG: PAS domain S-box protein, partial [Chloroflexi bacterium]|nr:PAS domain S-box protein [Chloroflexota bacterium]
MSDSFSNDLRQRALEILHGQPINIGKMSSEEIERIVYELQVHEVELQLQNEELRGAQQALLESRQKYADLYDLAPVGYLTVNPAGMVEEANLTATQMLDMARERLFRRPLVSHVAATHRQAFLNHLQRLFETQSPQRDELQLVRANGEVFYAQIDSTPEPAAESDPARCLMVITDITRRKQIELAEYEQRLFAASLRLIANVLNSTLDLDEVLDLILENVDYVVHYDVAEVILFEEDEAVIAGSRGYTKRELHEDVDSLRLPVETTPNLAHIRRTGQPLLVPDI